MGEVTPPDRQVFFPCCIEEGKEDLLFPSFLLRHNRGGRFSPLHQTGFSPPVFCLGATVGLFSVASCSSTLRVLPPFFRLLFRMSSDGPSTFPLEIPAYGTPQMSSFVHGRNGCGALLKACVTMFAPYLAECPPPGSTC